MIRMITMIATSRPMRPMYASKWGFRWARKTPLLRRDWGKGGFRRATKDGLGLRARQRDGQGCALDGGRASGAAR